MKILILSYNFFGYEKEIIEELKMNYEIKYVNLELTFLEMLYLYFIQIILSIKKRKEIYSKIINKKLKIKNSDFKNIDILFVLGFNEFNQNNFDFLNNNFNIKEKYLYLWDDVTRVKEFSLYKKYFNQIYSFDKKDCQENEFIYRPTFYSKRLEKLEKNKIKYEISFVGAYSIKRNFYLKNIIDKNFTNKFIYLYMDLKKYLKDYIFNLNYKVKDINFFKISKEKYNLIMSQSEIVIDLLQFNQTGVTQRTLDALYLNKKIITNNEYIKNYDFYNSNNILIINENTTEKEIRNFKNKKYIEINKEIIEYYSLERWIKDIFE